MFSLSQLLTLGIAYLAGLFVVAFLAERRIISDRVMSHPIVYVLSLGVITGSWAIYAIFELAQNYGYSFFTYYFGIVCAFVFAPLLLIPILRICRTYQLSSLADLLTFRFRSQWAGALITTGMLTAVLPLLALQVQAISDGIHILSAADMSTITTGDGRGEHALIFCCVIAIFALIFGSKRVSAEQRNNGLVAAIAFESLIKLTSFLVVGISAIYGIYGGFEELGQWLENNPQALELLRTPLQPDSARTLLVIFFAATIAMPHMFHMIFVEQSPPKALYSATWGVPLFLMLISLPVLPILWAGIKLDLPIPLEYSSLAIGLALDSPLLSAIAFICGLSAASAAIIISTLALASMCLNHLLLPLYLFYTKRPSDAEEQDIYSWLYIIRRILIIAIIVAGYLFFQLIDNRESLTNLGMIAFIGTLQFLPGILACVHWPRANRSGFISGLAAGFSVWFVALFLPAISTFDLHFLKLFYTNWFASPSSVWSTAAVFSLSLNICIFILVSLLTKTRAQEQLAAEICSADDLSRPVRYTMSINSPEEFHQRLAQVLGDNNATVEISRALNELQFSYEESRPFAMRQLRDRIEVNLSGLLGPAVAYKIVNQCMPYKVTESSDTKDINLIENRLDTADIHLTGLAADLDNLRRHHRQILHNLPIGVCSLGRDNEVLMWNGVMQSITGISASDIIGSRLSSAPAPWQEILGDFATQVQDHNHKQRVDMPGKQTRWVGLHQTAAPELESSPNDQLIVVEDLTDYQLLEQELVHTERLASVGRLAAGVAHEIGNPVTGIACLAQNLQYESNDKEVLEAARDILIQTERVSRIVQLLVNFSHSGSTNLSPSQNVSVNIAQCCDEAVHLLALNKDAKQVFYENNCSDHYFTLADHQRLLQVFINLLSNARDASSPQGQIVVDCTQRGNKVIITITDQGSGIPEQHREQIFEPFFTTKDPGDGTGLGLPLTYNIVNELGGIILVDSPLNLPTVSSISSGTRITVELPSANMETTFRPENDDSPTGHSD